MIYLTSTSDLFRVLTGSAGAIDVYASWVDITGTPPVATPGRTNTAQITGATTTTTVASPAVSTQRTVKFHSWRNASATVANTITVEHTDGTTLVTLVTVTLQPGDQLHYNDNTGFSYVPATTTIQVPGRLLLTTTKTTGSSFTTGNLTNTLRFRGVAGGGGGGGCTSVAAAAAFAGGGGGGGYMEKTVVVAPATAYAYVIGAAGAGNSGAGGGNGGDSTVTVGGTTYTAKGGTGAAAATASVALTADAGGAGGVVGTNGDINVPGISGEPGLTLLVAGPVGVSGAGGSGPYGAGGIGVTAVGVGSAGTGNGSGGGGAATGASTVRTGGVGTVGLIIFDEYA